MWLTVVSWLGAAQIATVLAAIAAYRSVTGKERALEDLHFSKDWLLQVNPAFPAAPARIEPHALAHVKPRVATCSSALCPPFWGYTLLAGRDDSGHPTWDCFFRPPTNTVGDCDQPQQTCHPSPNSTHAGRFEPFFSVEDSNLNKGRVGCLTAPSPSHFKPCNVGDCNQPQQTCRIAWFEMTGGWGGQVADAALVQLRI